MSGKTYGTCRWIAPDKQRPGEGACMKGADVRCGTLRGYMTCGCLDKACGSYEERTDSVEQVAVEILGSLVIRCASECGGWCVMWHDGACSAKFADRLRALGVTP